MNSIHLIGRLGGEPTCTSYGDDGGKRLGRFSLAIVDHKSASKEATWILVTVFDGRQFAFGKDLMVFRIDDGEVELCHFQQDVGLATKRAAVEEAWSCGECI